MTIHDIRHKILKKAENAEAELQTENDRLEELLKLFDLAKKKKETFWNKKWIQCIRTIVITVCVAAWAAAAHSLMFYNHMTSGAWVVFSTGNITAVLAYCVYSAIQIGLSSRVYSIERRLSMQYDRYEIAYYKQESLSMQWMLYINTFCRDTKVGGSDRTVAENDNWVKSCARVISTCSGIDFTGDETDD